MIATPTGAFRSLKNFNYRVWAAGALVSNIGGWMQRTAQAWLVLTVLTHNDAVAVGGIMALQFAPQLLLLPFSGCAADRLDRRMLLVCTQAGMGLLALALGTLVLTGRAQLWHVAVFAFVFGGVNALDGPARLTFVSELVGEDDLSNAVALNSTSMNAARMIGPAVAGVLIAALGSGWVYILNAVSFLAVLASLFLLRTDELNRPAKASAHAHGAFADGLRYVWQRPELKALLLMLFLIGTFGLNFPIFISTMSVSVYHAGAGLYGALTSLMAVGSMIGALLAAKRERPSFLLLLASASSFGVGCTLAAVAPNYMLFGVALIVSGISAQTFTTSANSLVQLTTDTDKRGRVMAIVLAVAVGGTPIGAPFVGFVAKLSSPRWSLIVGACAGFSALLVGIRYLHRYKNLRVRFYRSAMHLELEGDERTGSDERD